MLIAWLSSKRDGRSHFLLRCSPKPNKYLWCVSKNQGYCWRIPFKVLEVLYLAVVLPSSFAFQEGMWDTHIAALWGSPPVPGRYADTERRTPNGPDSDPSPTACTPASAPGHVARCGRGGMAPAACRLWDAHHGAGAAPG